ncbi:MAG: transposase [Propionivibrio sp.]|nr:transposase [Propionivibrio sp.]
MVENAIRPITLGRRNWLFTGSKRVGRRAAAIQSFQFRHCQTQRVGTPCLAR